MGRRAGIGDEVLLVVGPHSQDVDDVALREHLIDQSVLDIDASRVAAREVADQLLILGWRGERILSQDLQ